MGNGKRAKGKLKNRQLAVFLICCNLAPAPSPSRLRTFRIRRQKASSMRKNLSQSELNELPPLYKLPTFSA